MARPRNRKPQQTNEQEGNGNMSALDTSAFIEIDDEQLDSELQGARARGVYDENLLAFFRTGRRGVGINLEEGTHAGKKANSVKTGYESARVKIADGKNPNATDEDVEAAKATKVHAKTSPDRVFLTRSDIQRAG